MVAAFRTSAAEAALRQNTASTRPWHLLLQADVSIAFMFAAA